MAKDELVQHFLVSWKICNNHTISFVDKIPTNLWHKKPFDPYYKTFAWEFACIARTRECYIRGLETGELRFEEAEDIPNIDKLERMPKRKIIELLQKQARRIGKLINRNKNLWMIAWLLQHERLHHGKLILYFSKAKLKYPSSFMETWGKSNFE